MNKEELNDDYYPDYKATVNPVRTLRDEFAMAAMNGILRNFLTQSHFQELTAITSYEIADAMMKARGDNNGSV